MADTFQYKVRDRSGTLLSGSLVADSEALVLARLREQGYTPLDVKREKKGIGQIEFGGKKVKLKQVAVFSRQFATMVNSGLPILRALAILADQTDNKELARVLGEARLDVEQGSSLSGALGKHDHVFNNLYISMVRAGETGGSLDSTLLRVAEMIEKEVQLRGKIKSAMTYPIAVVALVVLIMSAMLLFVVPQFKGIYGQLGGTLPLPTRSLLFVSGRVQVVLVHLPGRDPRGPVLLPPLEADRTRPRGGRRDQAARPRVRLAVPPDRAVEVLQHAGDAAPLRRADPPGARDRERDREQQGDRQGDRRRADLGARR